VGPEFLEEASLILYASIFALDRISHYFSGVEGQDLAAEHLPSP